MKIGLLGGSFDPPHFGHVGISKEALELLKLDEIWWLPTKQNPLKNLVNSGFEERLKLCQEISKNEPRILVKDLENNLESSYLIDLLTLVLKENPKHEFCLLIGADSLLNFHLWKDWQDILQLVKIAVFERENWQEQAKQSATAHFAAKLFKQDHKERLIFLKNKKYAVSSTEIRNKNE